MSGTLKIFNKIASSRMCRAFIVTGVAGVCCLTGVGYARSFGANSKNILLKHVSSPASGRPTLVLIHGLDSAKDTWVTFMEGLQKRRIDSIALDLRGHGESALGDPNDFSVSQLAEDIRHTVDVLGIQKPFVLLGHSMGGKVAMQYASKFPEDVCSLIIEDMHHWESKSCDDFSSLYEQRKNFNRSFPSFELLSETLQKFGYAEARILDWKKYGRVFQKEDGSWWSNISPFSKLLAWKHVLALNYQSQLNQIVNSHKIPVHLHFAKWEHSSCKKESVKQMEAMGVKTLQFPKAYHSIHNTQRESMLNAVEKIVTCAQYSKSEMK